MKKQYEKKAYFWVNIFLGSCFFTLGFLLDLEIVSKISLFGLMCAFFFNAWKMNL